MKRIVCVGEILQVFDKKDKGFYKSYFYSKEVEVLKLLKNDEIEISYLTSLPKNTIGEEAKKYIDDSFFNLGNIHFTDGRMGNVFENNDEVIIDRKYSVFYFSSVMNYDFKGAFKNASWFHSSIDVASISSANEKILINAYKEAKHQKIKTSLDMFSLNNYWRIEDSIAFVSKIHKYIDFLFINKEILEYYKEESVSEVAIKRIYKLFAVKNILIAFNNESYFYDGNLITKIASNSEFEAIHKCIEEELLG